MLDYDFMCLRTNAIKPWVEDGDDLSTPAKRWGVATEYPGVLLCGSGARRGGAVSGIGGHNAAMAVIESN